MVWSFLKDKLTAHVRSDLEDTQNELDRIKTAVQRRDQQVNGVEQRLDALQRQVDELSQILTDIHAWNQHAYRKLETHEQAVTDLTTLLSNNLPDTAAEPASSTAEHTTDDTLVETSKREIQRPDDENKRLDVRLDGEGAGEERWSAATPAQKEILMELYERGYPVSYRELASDLEKSVSTVKNHVNALKSKGFEFEERRGPDNAKRYQLGEADRSLLAMKIHA